MSDGSEPTQSGARPMSRPSGRERLVSRLGVALSVGWLLLPAAQYYATVQRTRFLVREIAEPGPLADLDLTPAYMLLLLLTVVFGLQSYFERRRTGQLGTQTGPKPGGAA